MRAVADTGPINYLILVGAVEILPRLFETVALSQDVLRELLARGAPAEVRNWAKSPPTWVQGHETLSTTPQSLGLDAGELSAISLALSTRADLLLIDERKGTLVAREHGLATLGTLGLIERAARRGLLDLQETVTRLRRTNFRASPHLIDELLTRRLEP